MSRAGSGFTISSKDVTVRFGHILALDSFSVNVPQGVVGLLGPNGAGKSTFIRTLLGLVVPEKGSMTIGGHDPRIDMARVRDMVGYMPEHDCLMDGFNAVELVSYMGRISGMVKKDAIPRSHEVLDFVGVGEERYRQISSYSTGMKQRVKLAQAIVHDPRILFLDEPTNGMDPQGRSDMLDLISKISSSDKSLLVASHILDDVEKISGHVVIVNSGRLVTEGDIDVLLAKKELLRRVQARGRPDAMKDFARLVGEAYEVRSESQDLTQVSMVILNEGDGTPLFNLARKAGVQLRAYHPERSTLEDLFIGAIGQSDGGGKDGH
jgi:ABC-2 type transport system ATP-binding protein